MNIKRDIRFRVYIAFTCLAVLGLAIILKAASIQKQEGAELRELAQRQTYKKDTLLAERGNIFTEEGDLLCSSIPQFDISLDLTVVHPDTFGKHVDAISRGIFAILKTRTASEWKVALVNAYNAKKRYFPLGRNIHYQQFMALRSLPVFNKGRRKGGFIASSETKRIYPYDELARRTIGRFIPGTPPLGIEAYCDSLLRGTNGSRMLQKMTGGVYMPLEGSEVEPQDGFDIVTTLNLNIQNVAENSLKSVLQQYQCLNGTAIVMEVQTGKIRAMVNLGRDSAGNYRENQNYALQRAEPGSTFKAVTLLSLLNDGYINVTDNVNCEGGQHHFANRTMHDSHHGLGSMPIKDAYAHSSNVAMAKLAYEHYAADPKKYMEHLEKFGIDKKTGIDLRGETPPDVIKPGTKHWNATTLPWMATGYGILITPLRTCMVYNAVANGGNMMKPYLVSSISQYGRKVKEFQPEVVCSVGDTNTVRQMQDCMKEVVLSGTGHHIMSPYYGIAGKTGTAQVADMINGKWYGYKAGVYQGSFVGFFPAEKPRYTIMIMIRTRPHSGAYYGGTLAAPVFRMISDKVFSTAMGSWRGPLDSFARKTVGISGAKAAPAQQYSTLFRTLRVAAAQAAAARSMAQVMVDSSRRVTIAEKRLYKGAVPDVTGMGLRDAVYMLEREGLHVLPSGAGAVAAQSIAPGSRIAKGQTIYLTLN